MRPQSLSRSCLACGGFITHGCSYAQRARSVKPCCVWRNVPMTPRSAIAHPNLGLTWFLLSALPIARQHFEEGITRYTPDQHRSPVFRMGQDPGVACRTYAAMTLWLLYPAQALAHVHGALALAHELSHPYSLACTILGGLGLSGSSRRAGRASMPRPLSRSQPSGASPVGGLGHELAWVGTRH